jgi:Calpain family cysteine protease
MACQIDKPYSTTPLLLPNGLLVNHTYGILNLAKVDKQHLIQLHNPHGKGEWNGSWSENSPIWSKFPELESTLLGRHTSTSSGHSYSGGTFWMSYEDFIQNFNAVDVTHIVYPHSMKQEVLF